jgi:site-specific DNA-methyltransferase (adenine-specific)
MKTKYLDIRNMDCNDLMMDYPDNHFDLAVVDPPYFEAYGKENYTGASVTKGGVKRMSTNIENWDVPDLQYFNELIRVSKNQIIWGCNYYAKYIPHVGRIVWDKMNDSSTFSKCEIASHSKGLIVDQFRFMWNGMLQGDMKNKEERIHPTQKPVKLYDWIFANYAEKGMTILDTHMGSGSIAIAAHYAGMHLTACELDPDYYKAACKRIERETRQTTFDL